MTTPKVLLTITSTHDDLQAHPASIRRRLDGRYEVQDRPRARWRLLAGTTPSAAFDESCVLRFSAETAVHVRLHTGCPLALDDVLALLRPVGDPLPVEEWADDRLEEFWAVAEASQRWSTTHCVRINGEAVFAVRSDEGGLTWVRAADPERPHRCWTEILALNWNNDSNCAVGMANAGVDGIYSIRPGLIATVRSDDENYDLRLQRTSPYVPAEHIVANNLGALWEGETIRDLLRAGDAASGEHEQYLTTDLGAAFLHGLVAMML